MNFDNLTDEDLQTLREIPKRVKNPRGKRSSPMKGSLQVGYELASRACNFAVYVRQNSLNADHYSAGIRAVKIRSNGEDLVLSRFNGSDHSHGEFKEVCHIHHTTAESQHKRKPEDGRMVGGGYTDVKGALQALMDEYNVHGIQLPLPLVIPPR